VVHPDRVLTNRGARPGDALVLTKPLGTGVIFNANRAGKYPKDLLEGEVLPVVAALNRVPLETALRHEVHALTDITGFGFAGHALEMARGSGVRLAVSFRALPLYPAAAEMYGEAPVPRQLGFMKREIEAPDDFDEMGAGRWGSFG